MPFIVLALFWWKRKELLTPRVHTWMPGLLIIAAGLPAVYLDLDLLREDELLLVAAWQPN